MRCVSYCFHQRCRVGDFITAIAALLRPLLHQIPIIAERRVRFRRLEPRRFEIRYSNESLKIVCVAGIYILLVREIESPCLFRDTRLQSALHRVARQIVSSIPMFCTQ